MTILKSQIHVTMSNVYVLCDNITLHAIIDNESIAISIVIASLISIIETCTLKIAAAQWGADVQLLRTPSYNECSPLQLVHCY